jgi:phosphohistidine phosphatase SixA
MRLTIPSASVLRLAVVCLSMLAAAPGRAQHLDGPALLQSLRQGGLVILMRHAASPRTPPDREHARPDNATLERQLDDEGRATAAAMGRALRDLQIPIGEVLSSPTYRALETAKLARLPTPRAYPELGDSGHSMQAASASQSSWLQRQVMRWPTKTNTVVVTHLPNIAAAFPDYSQGLADGEALVLGPDGKEGIRLLGRVKIEEWTELGR